MKFQELFVCFLIFAYCNAFPQKSLLDKRFTMEDLEKIDAETRGRIEKECNPSFMVQYLQSEFFYGFLLFTFKFQSCLADCKTKESTCLECENQMAECVRDVTLEIYAKYNIPIGYKKKGSLLKDILG